MTIREIKKEIKGVFKQPKIKYYIGRIFYGEPYFIPYKFNSTIFSFRKLKLRVDYKNYNEKHPHLKDTNSAKFSNLPTVRRNKDWIVKLFGNYYFIQIGFPIIITWYGLGWKDKFDSPRFEWSPSFQIYFFKWQFCIFWNANYQYYEQILWYLYYSDKDIDKAKETWPWTDYPTKLSTWNDDFLIINNDNRNRT